MDQNSGAGTGQLCVAGELGAGAYAEAECASGVELCFHGDLGVFVPPLPAPAFLIESME